MKNIRSFLSENFQFLEVKFSVCLNRFVFVIGTGLQIISSYCINHNRQHSEVFFT